MEEWKPYVLNVLKGREMLLLKIRIKFDIFFNNLKFIYQMGTT